jgi:hypothetical protein
MPGVLATCFSADPLMARLASRFREYYGDERSNLQMMF